jgi:alkylhydroperoxidase/carboxymuconolactone decarboxylase family protein YurZ
MIEERPGFPGALPSVGGVGAISGAPTQEGVIYRRTFMHVHERNTEKKRLNGLMLKSPMKVYRAFGEIGKEVFADGALSKKHKELTALAVAVSQNCFD